MGLKVSRSDPADTPRPPPPLGGSDVELTAALREARAGAPSPHEVIHQQILGRIDPGLAIQMSAQDLLARVGELVAEIANERRLLLNQPEQKSIAGEIVADMVGHGPLEPLLNDPTVSDILVNGPNQIYVERKGKLVATDVRFHDDAHVLRLAQRIASSIGRRVDQSSPMLDARLADGSRVNVVIPPLSLRGTTISIRKFARSFIGFGKMVEFQSVSRELARVLEVIARCRLNVVISGGTGSGKTTMLNALSSLVDPGERIVTIEDTAELQLQQPHVVQLESRPANIEGGGMVSQRDLLRNALRMRPDRIVVGEVRGAECFDMMQAMNTGHNGSLGTIHANSARDALARLENMILMADLNLPSQAIKAQIVSAVDVVVQVERMRDGTRRVTEVVEVVRLEGDTVTLAPLFTFKYSGENSDGSVAGSFEPSGIRPTFLPKLEYFGLDQAFLQATAPRPATH